MKAQGLIGQTRRRFKVTTDTQHTLPVASNHLNRQFEADRPDQRYVGDITYIPTRQGWLYLAIVLDLFSRPIVGWAMEPHMKTGLVNNALTMALWQRKPLEACYGMPTRGGNTPPKVTVSYWRGITSPKG